MKKWNIISKLEVKSSEFGVKEIIKTLLENRGIKTKEEITEFLNPKLERVTIASVGIDQLQLKKALKRIEIAIEKKEKIVVFGDYDVDGIAGSAILWETLFKMGANVLPYIPHRIDEGYGLSIKAIQSSEFIIQNPTLIITIDNGIVASDAVDFTKKLGIDVIITDHHVPLKKLPKAVAIVHTTKLCGTAVAWMLAQELKSSHSGRKSRIDSGVANTPQNDNSRQARTIIPGDHLALVALATVADLVPLTGANRTLLKFGLKELRKTKRIGLKALFKDAAINAEDIGTYEIGHIIAPRLNAMGRLEYAMDSLRLLCTNNPDKANALSLKLGSTNRERQLITQETVAHAKSAISNQQSAISKLIFISHESYQPGVIGLVAGRLVEEFYKPSIVVSIGEKHSKASARSVSGFNIIEFIRSASDLLVDAGGHPMAAGFTVETAKLSLLIDALQKKAEEILTDELLTRSLSIDCELSLSLVNEKLFGALQDLAPFGMGNPEPTFASTKVVIEDMRLVGQEGKHVKFRFSQKKYSSREEQKATNREVNSSRLRSNNKSFDGIGFGLGDRSAEFHVGDAVDIAYTIDLNEWNGNKSLQLKIKDIKRAD